MVQLALEPTVPATAAALKEVGASSGEKAALPGQLSVALDRVSQDLLAARRPDATYRLQFGRQLGFADATALIPYLHGLGITHIYSSPYLKSSAGSSHGYDIVDHSLLNPELGNQADFDAFVSALRANAMGHILDFVPNHMGVATDENLWWQDVLENGPSSRYASFFDIDWSPLKLDLAKKVLLPVLGDQFGHVLENQELRLEFSGSAFVLRYYQRTFPIAPRSYGTILRHRLEELIARMGNEHPCLLEYQSILTAISHLPSLDATELEKVVERDREKEVIKRRLQRLCDESPDITAFIRENVALLNGQKGAPRSFDLLEGLLREQAYRLSFWRVASDEINYRRFFDVNELAAVCMEQPEVFARCHDFVLKLIEDRKLDGLRIDHADGLYDPTGYLRMLQEERLLQLCREELALQGAPSNGATQSKGVESQLGEGDRHILRKLVETRLSQDPSSPLRRPMYVVVEKILERNERLPDDWPVDGTTGYDFLNDVNGLFVDGRNERALDQLYARFVGTKESFDELVYQSKRLIMRISMSGELSVLAHQLDRISECNRSSYDFTLNGLTFALREIVACFPVYRTYTASDHVLERDRGYVEQAAARARRRHPAMSHAVFDFVRDILLHRGLADAAPHEREMRSKFVGRFQQFTGPMMAKAVEDTAFYRYHRLVSLNEVGGDPKRFGLAVNAFHQQNLQRRAAHPHSLLATTTHDTKRSEDVRARINVISEIPDVWKKHVLRWSRWNKRKKTKVDGELAPGRKDEYLLYQTLLGTWPVPGVAGDELETYQQRIQEYMTKAIREAKVHSSWIAPHEAYERATSEFVAALLSSEPASAFRVDVEPLAARVARCGMWNSLSQTLLKLTSPGVPDIYPGTELWSLTLVDPDNRRPVDFASLADTLRQLSERKERMATDLPSFLRETLENSTGLSKLFLTAETLRLRRAFPELFTLGAYLPLEVLGSQAERVCAFARVHHGARAMIAAPRLIAGLTWETGAPPIGPAVWDDTLLHLPEEFRCLSWRNVFCGGVVSADPSGALSLAEILRDFPVGLLVSD